MKTISVLTALLLSCGAAFGEDKAPTALHRDPAPPASTVSQDLFWVADTVKMDRFLAQVDLAAIQHDAYPGEVLPDTRGAWRDYASEAWEFAGRGEDARVIERISQMLKLAALYRQFGGLQNVAQGEEIRALAGQTVQRLGYGGLISSPYLESNPEECVALIERQAGVEKSEVRPIFWQHMIETACQSFARLSGQPGRGLASVSTAFVR
jgi:hypothetical protein